MLSEVYKLQYYVDEREQSPFIDWINSLEKVDRAKIRVRLDRVILGNLGEVKTLKDGVYELKFKNHSGFRIYFAYDGDTIILLLIGGNKETQKKDIAKAKVYWLNYNKRKESI